MGVSLNSKLAGEASTRRPGADLGGTERGAYGSNQPMIQIYGTCREADTEDSAIHECGHPDSPQAWPDIFKRGQQIRGDHAADSGVTQDKINGKVTAPRDFERLGSGAGQEGTKPIVLKNAREQHQDLRLFVNDQNRRILFPFRSHISRPSCFPRHSHYTTVSG